MKDYGQVQNPLTSCTGMSKIYINLCRCHKTCPYMISNRKRRSLGKLRNSYKTMMMTAIQDTSMRLMLLTEGSTEGTHYLSLVPTWKKED